MLISKIAPPEKRDPLPTPPKFTIQPKSDTSTGKHKPLSNQPRKTRDSTKILSILLLCFAFANPSQIQTCNAKAPREPVVPSAKSEPPRGATQSQSTPKPRRLASFAPSCTELIEAINAQNSLVGVCKFCQLSKALENKIERVGDFNSANIERLIRLKPDMVLAVSGQDALVHSLEQNKISVITFQNSRLSDISANLQIIGNLTNHKDAANAKALEFDKAVSELKKICQPSMPDKSVKPSVFFCVWPQPLLTAGRSSFLNDAIAACGGRNVAADLMTAYPHYSLERLAITDPDIVIMPYEAKSEQYLNRAPWSTLRANKEHRLFFLVKEESDRLSRPQYLCH